MLKAKKFSQTVMRLPSLEKIEHYTYFSVIIGAPLLLMALSLGVVWVVLEGNHNLLYDPKVINSFCVGGLCVLFIPTEVDADFRLQISRLESGSFFVVVLNFVVSNFFSGFHDWIWS